MRISPGIRWFASTLALVVLGSVAVPASAVDRGKEYLRTGQVEKAKEYYEEWLAKDAESTDALAGMGGVLIASAMFDEAMDMLEAGLELDPKHFQLNLNLALAYYYKAKELADRGRSAVAVGSLLRDGVRKAEIAVECDGTKAEGYQTMGIIQQFQSEFEASVVSLQTATELDPEDSYSWFLLGESYRFSEDYEMAARAYQKAANTFEDGYYEAYRMLGLCYQWQEKEEEAAKAYLSAIEVAPELPTAWDDLWNLYAAQKKFEEAATLYEKLVKQHSDNAYVHLVLGSVYAYDARDDEAVSQFKKALKLAKDPEIKSAAYYQMGLTHKELREEEKAVAALKKSLKYAPEFEEPIAVLSGIARDRSDAGHYQRAAAVLEFLANFQKTDGFVWSDLGLVYRDWEKYTKSLAAYEKAVKFEPNDAQILNDYAVVLDYHFDRVDEAYRLYVEALELENNVDAMQNLCRVYIKQGKFQEAIDLATLALEFDSGRAVVQKMLDDAKRRLAKSKGKTQG